MRAYLYILPARGGLFSSCHTACQAQPSRGSEVSHQILMIRHGEYRSAEALRPLFLVVVPCDLAALVLYYIFTSITDGA